MAGWAAAAKAEEKVVAVMDLIVVQLWLQLRVVHRMQPDDVRLDGLVEQSR